MIVIGTGKCIEGVYHDQPRALKGSRTISHKNYIELNTRKHYSNSEIINKVNEMTELVKTMYELYNKFILSNLKHF
jgi:hypothetical protein